MRFFGFFEVLQREDMKIGGEGWGNGALNGGQGDLDILNVVSTLLQHIANISWAFL